MTDMERWFTYRAPNTKHLAAIARINQSAQRYAESIEQINHYPHESTERSKLCDKALYMQKLYVELLMELLPMGIEMFRASRAAFLAYTRLEVQDVRESALIAREGILHAV